MKTTILLTSMLLSAGGLLVNSNRTENSATSKTAAPIYKALAATKRMASMPVAPMYIVVDKRKYELSVYDAKGWFATYPVVFGNNTLEDKKMEGDRNTPEGTFRINGKRPHAKWDKFISIDYPNQESLAKFKRRKERGEIPSWASPGGEIGIHGTWLNEDFVVDKYKNWTLGCISLKRRDVDDLYSYLPVGTTITIRK
ncbi:MAG: murein L,D-transpeptidase [Chitinophagaceae bacterium]|nr:MAG: murein L,D-transpeptidase [Chitinophagaceae bacterium]